MLTGMAFLAMGTMGFWILCAAVCVLLIVAVEYEKTWLATLSLVVTFVALAYFGDFNLAIAVKNNPLLSAVCFLGYFGAGTAWMVCRWAFYIRDRRRDYDQALEDWQERQVQIQRDIQRYGSASASDWRPGVNHKPDAEQYHPRVRDNKTRLTTWQVYWPFSLTWTVINDPVKRLFRRIFDHLRVTLQKMSDKVFADAFKAQEIKPTEVTPQ